jgi:hypothetical protein
MTSETFENMRKRVIREHKHWIVRSARKGHQAKGRGLVLVKCNKAGTVHLSYVSLETLKDLPEDLNYGSSVIEKISAYRPDCEIPVMFTDGETERLSFGVRQ